MEMFLRQQISQVLMYDFINRLMNCQLSSGDNIDSSSDGLTFSARIVIVNSDPDMSQMDNPDPLQEPDMTQYDPVVSRLDESYISRRSLQRSTIPSTYSVVHDPSILFMLAFGLLLIIGFTYLLSQPPRRQDLSPGQKLSIYGDGETLAAIDDIDDSLIDVKPRAALLVATEDPTVLLKLPVKSL
jgi:hypothetical protein